MYRQKCAGTGRLRAPSRPPVNQLFEGIETQLASRSRLVRLLDKRYCDVLMFAPGTRSVSSFFEEIESRECDREPSPDCGHAGMRTKGEEKQMPDEWEERVERGEAAATISSAV